MIFFKEFFSYTFVGDLELNVIFQTIQLLLLYFILPFINYYS